MVYDEACSLCGREGGSMHVIALDTGEPALVCSDCERAAGDDLLVAVDDSEVLSESL